MTGPDKAPRAEATAAGGRAPYSWPMAEEGGEAESCLKLSAGNPWSKVFDRDGGRRGLDGALV